MKNRQVVRPLSLVRMSLPPLLWNHVLSSRPRHRPARRRRADHRDDNPAARCRLLRWVWPFEAWRTARLVAHTILGV